MFLDWPAKLSDYAHPRVPKGSQNLQNAGRNRSSFKLTSAMKSFRDPVADGHAR